MAFAVLQNEIPDPEQIRPYCAMAVALDTHEVLNGLEKGRTRHVLTRWQFTSDIMLA
jgi:hypothetical protein